MTKHLIDIILLLLLIPSIPSQSQEVDDIVIEGEIIEIDSPRVFSIRGKQGYTHNFCFLHLKVKVTKGDCLIRKKLYSFSLIRMGLLQMILIRPELYRSTNIGIQLWPPNPSCRRQYIFLILL
jgi:hypothetical protein